MPTETTVIMVFGTFDGLHEGHKNFFKQARDLAQNPFLIVSIARDNNVLKIKGKLPFLNERERKGLLESCSLVDKVVLGDVEGYIDHIKNENPKIIALGYDQWHYTESLGADLKSTGINAQIFRLKPYKENIYKNSLLRASN